MTTTLQAPALPPSQSWTWFSGGGTYAPPSAARSPSPLELPSRSAVLLLHSPRERLAGLGAGEGETTYCIARSPVEHCFAWQVYASMFEAEAACVRPQFQSGTHAIACALFGLLRPGQEMLAISGPPYDTLEEVTAQPPASRCPAAPVWRAAARRRLTGRERTGSRHLSDAIQGPIFGSSFGVAAFLSLG